MGYMITNFNDITFEDGNVLEMNLDWFDAYTALSAVPTKHLAKLLQGGCLSSDDNKNIVSATTQYFHAYRYRNKHSMWGLQGTHPSVKIMIVRCLVLHIVAPHHKEQLYAEEKDRHHIKLISAEKHNRGIAERQSRKRSSVDTLDKAAKQQRLHVVPWDEASNLERLKHSSSHYKVLQVAPSTCVLIFPCSVRFPAAQWMNSYQIAGFIQRRCSRRMIIAETATVCA